jgi:putative permease
MQLLTRWFKHYFSDPEVVFLSISLLVGFAIVLTMGDMLAPVLASVEIAYLLEGVVVHIERHNVPRLAAVLIVYIGFLLFLILILLGLLPLLSRQVTELFQQIPGMISKGQGLLMQLPQSYPELISTQQVQELLNAIQQEITRFGQLVLSISFASVVDVITVLVYLILMPMLVFFFLKDKGLILNWLIGFLPRNRRLAGRVWREVDRQIGNYVRGKFWEIIIVWSASFVTFVSMGLDYAMLLGVLVGLSVIIPYIGAAVVTFPVILIAWFQWGWGPDFIWLSAAYFIIQVLDGNLLGPLLFSEAVNLHPGRSSWRFCCLVAYGGSGGFFSPFPWRRWCRR